jgi:hypothetical protein
MFNNVKRDLKTSKSEQLEHDLKPKNIEQIGGDLKTNKTEQVGGDLKRESRPKRNASFVTSEMEMPEGKEVLLQTPRGTISLNTESNVSANSTVQTTLRSSDDQGNTSEQTLSRRSPDLAARSRSDFLWARKLLECRIAGGYDASGPPVKPEEPPAIMSGDQTGNAKSALRKWKAMELKFGR